MEQINLKTHYTAQELADMRLPGLPFTRPGIMARAKSGSWGLRARNGRGGGNEYALESLPTEAQEAIRTKVYQAVLVKKNDEHATNTVTSRQLVANRDDIALLRQCPAILERKVSELTEKQKQIADARAALAMEVEKLRDAGMSRTAAVKYIASASRDDSLPEHLQAAAAIANARKGSTRKGVGERSLQEWVSIFETSRPGIERLSLLAPGHQRSR